MQQFGQSSVRPALRDLVLEASRALAQLDAGKLESLAISCEALNRDLNGAGPLDRDALVSEARCAAMEMGAFARVLDATKANLQVMNRMKELKAGLAEYGPSAGRS